METKIKKLITNEELLINKSEIKLSEIHSETSSDLSDEDKINLEIQQEILLNTIILRNEFVIKLKNLSSVTN